MVLFLIFSPVLIWNYQNHWVSIEYQLNHGFNHRFKVDHCSQIKTYLLNNLISYNLSLVLLIWVIWRNRYDIFKSYIHGILLFPTLTVFFLFLISAYFAPTQMNWSAPFFFTGSIYLASYLAPYHVYFKKNNVKFMKQILIYSSLVISLTILIEEGFSEKKWLKSLVNTRRGEGIPAAMKVLTSQIPAALYQNKPIFVDQYQLGAYLAYFLKQSPTIFAATPSGNQYYYWWLKEHDTHGNERLKDGFIYMSYQAFALDNPLLKSCILEKRLMTTQQQLFASANTRYLFIYSCKELSNLLS